MSAAVVRNIVSTWNSAGYTNLAKTAGAVDLRHLLYLQLRSLFGYKGEKSVVAVQHGLSEMTPIRFFLLCGLCLATTIVGSSDPTPAATPVSAIAGTWH